MYYQCWQFSFGFVDQLVFDVVESQRLFNNLGSRLPPYLTRDTPEGDVRRFMSILAQARLSHAIPEGLSLQQS